MNNNVSLVVVVGVIALIVGYMFKSKERDMQQYAGELAINESVNYVKSEAQITKDWANSLTNYWKQVWK